MKIPPVSGDRTPLHRLSLGMALIVPFALLLTLPVILVAVFTTGAIRQSNADLIIQLGDRVARETTERLERLMEAPLLLNALNARALAGGHLDPDDPASRNIWFSGMLETFPQVSYTYFGRPDRQFHGARRNETDGIEALRNDNATGGDTWYFTVDDRGLPISQTATAANYDCRVRPWYTEAVRTGGPVFSGIYKHFVYHDLAITAARPVFASDGSLRGVLGVDFRLDRLNGLLQEMLPVRDASITILEGPTGEVVANSLGVPDYTDSDGTFRRIRLDDLPESSGDAGPDNAPTRQPAGSLTYPGHKGMLHRVVRDFSFRGLDWQILVTIPDREFTGAMESTLRGAILLCLGTLAVALLTGFLLSRRILMPVNQLVQAARLISGGNWEYPPPRPGYRELNTLSDAFASMALRIKSSMESLEDTVALRTRELAERNSELARANATKDRFFAIMAHDLRGPVGSMSVLLESLACGSACVEPGEMPAVLDDLSASARGIRNLLENLLTWAMAQRKEIHCSPAMRDMEELARQTIEVLEGQARNKGIALTREGPACTVWADEDMIRTVLRNLAGNAIKFTPRGGKVLLSWKELPDHVVVEVTDTGTGMDAEMQASLFRTDVLAHRQGTDGEQGTGLGLLMCREFVEQNRGTIDVESTPGKGSCFRITLPRGENFPAD